MPSVQTTTLQTSNEDFNPFLLDDLFFPGSKNKKPVQGLKKLTEGMLGLHYLATEYNRLEPSHSPREFIQRSFNKLNIDYQLKHGSLDSVPASGSSIVVANHPFGGIEGMILIDLLLQRRPDVKVMANGILKRIPELSDMFIAVDPYGTRQAAKNNTAPLKEALRWLKQGGCLVVFPAGDVSSISLKEMRIRDNDWDKSIIRMAKLTQSQVTPIFIAGKNSMVFYLASLLHPFLKTLLLPRQIINKRGKKIDLSIGKTITLDKIKSFSDDKKLSEYLRACTYLLSHQEKDSYTFNDVVYEEVIKEIDSKLLQLEISQLPGEQMLHSSGEMQVYYASSDQIPWVLQEIGRLREISFRAIGEGTGKRSDIDLYDSFYSHLFIWDTKNQVLVGSYRMCKTDEVLKGYGLKGLYTHSLFKYNASFLHKVGPSIELGRSFVRQEYQRSFSPLMLLWKGISIYVGKNPEYKTLFGPVSISNDYSEVSQELIIDYLKKCVYDEQVARFVKARNPYREKPHKDKVTLKRLLENNPDSVSEMISSVENDNKGLPVLIKQYLKMGGQIAGFNIDHDFNNCIDGLIRVNLAMAPEKLVEKYMGKSLAEKFFAYHQQQETANQ